MGWNGEMDNKVIRLCLTRNFTIIKHSLFILSHTKVRRELMSFNKHFHFGDYLGINIIFFIYNQSTVNSSWEGFFMMEFIIETNPSLKRKLKTVLRYRQTPAVCFLFIYHFFFFLFWACEKCTWQNSSTVASDADHRCKYPAHHIRTIFHCDLIVLPASGYYAYRFSESFSVVSH